MTSLNEELNMCDQDSIDDINEYARRSEELTRRRFGAWALASGATMMLPAIAGALDVTETEIEIKTPDGVADAYFVHPSSGAHPGVLMWPHILGLRPAFRSMGKRLAQSGYSVLVPNPFYRATKAPVVPEGASFDDPETRQKLMSLMGSLTPDVQVMDAKSHVGYLSSQAAVDRRRKLGTAGYCMGGPLTMRTAAAFPDRVGGGASFHGGSLATDKPDSPHLLVPKMKARYLFAIAENDDQRDPAAKDLLREAFAKARLAAEIEVYAGTMHGWCPLDSKVYNQPQAEKAWGRMLALFKTALA
jgi:carboxymethylenebutenolidase